MFKKVFSVFGDSNEKELRRLQPAVERINELEPRFQQLTPAELKAKTDEYRKRLDAGESLEDILPEAFAAVREAARRTLNMRHFDVQLLGGIVLHQGKIAEMKTGEGKTLAATLAIYLNALPGKGVHLVTVNDYLAKRDTQWMGPVYDTLRMSIGCIQHDSAFLFDPAYDSGDPAWPHLRPVHRRAAYEADITYGTNNEFGFDYLRDNMVTDLSQRVQRPFHYAIVDEVDNILIDEARTPLIISGQAEESGDIYRQAHRAVERVRKGITQAEFDQMKDRLGANEAMAKVDAEYDYIYDEKARNVILTAGGQHKVASAFGDPDMYGEAGREEAAAVEAVQQRLKNIHHVDTALRAKVFYRRDKEYVVRDGEVVIVDEFTGRMMPGRRYSEGLHQAIEAKEGVKIQRETITMATITFQNYFRMYPKLAGMTGTAVTEAEEFHKIYGLDVVIIPTNRPFVRAEYPDQVYRSIEGKRRAVVREIEEYQRAGRPVLVGTTSVEESEIFSGLLTKRGIAHQVLNAKHHEQEAYVIAQAGMPGAVTIATNMAGRGVDILLGGNPEGMARDQLRKEEVNLAEISVLQWNDALGMLRRGEDPTIKYPERWCQVLAEKHATCEENKKRVIEAGGLHIIGTERHEARRIDNQLRGRAGRQGDPGSARFYVSVQDDIMRRFGGDRIGGIMDRFGFDEDTPIEHKMITRAIENTQVKVEAHHFDIRKRLIDYDDVLNKHREVIYGEREKLLQGADLKANIRDMIDAEISRAVFETLLDEHGDEWDLDGLLRRIGAMMPLPREMTKGNLEAMSRGEIEENLLNYAGQLYDKREQEMGSDEMRLLERLVILRSIDRHWVEHLTVLDNMRQSIGLQAYAQRDPLVAYKTEAHSRFQELQDAIRRDIVHTIYHVVLRKSQPPQEEKKQESRKAAVPAGRKVGRNEPCPCGSGKKYKKCCGA